MNVKDFIYFLENPTKVVEPIHTKHLEDIITEYPYFQAARALHLKGLKNLNSYKYNKALKTTAAFTTDRDVLFDFITSKDFLHYDGSEKTIDESIQPKEGNVDNETVSLIEASADKPLPQDKDDAEHILDPELFQSKHATSSKEEETLELGKPLTFDTKEKYSFSEWLSLASNSPAEKTPAKAEVEKKNNLKASTKMDSAKKNKFDRIDKFIANNPKIVPTEQKNTSTDISSSTEINKNELMTETLARVYLEQKKYNKAIQAFKILSLKYPEKSGFFADRIKAVEKIQKDNKE
ncbi:hypothetical protein [Maribacter sp. ACAM166]|uniref:hypothetical protein n=1 Tax=Maribacter sp. ACAM166 TaxID=2508996 RepID=UPI0010FD4C51|nr:hypothetical protein [Maribacter sp. ACAM166]TLP82783.1 hypothetical protein ES765_01065 [Maribacter sp. ACAM166]